MINLTPIAEQVLVELHMGADLTSDVEGASRALAIISGADDLLCPEWILVGEERRPYTTEAAAAAWNEDEDHELFLIRSDLPMWSTRWRVRRRAKRVTTRLSMELPMTMFASASASDALVAALEAIASEYQCIYGFANASSDYSLGESPVDPVSGPTMKVVEVYWLNLLGAGMVKKLGARRVQSTPAHRVEALPDGTVMICTRPTPVDYYTEETCRARACALAHLRPDLDAETIIKQQVARGSVLAPVEHDWDPDISRLLEYSMMMVPVAQRRDRERAYNAFRPTVEEWIPASAVPPPELDAAEATRSYSDQAENIRVVVHTRLDIVGSSDPEWLEKLDAFFWTYAHNYFSQPAHLEKVIVAIGAFVGLRLVKNLGGTWVPRRSIDETAVLVGDRAWLPFLRARHYSKSRETVIEYSLMKFFREAERHR